MFLTQYGRVSGNEQGLFITTRRGDGSKEVSSLKYAAPLSVGLLMLSLCIDSVILEEQSREFLFVR